MKTLPRALQFFRPERARILGVLALMLAGIGANLLKPWPVAAVVDALGGARGSDAHHFAAEALLYAVALLGITLMHGGLNAWQNFLAIGIGLRGLRRVRNEVFDKLQRLSLRFHHSRNTGDLLHRAAWDTYSFQTLFQQGLMTTVSAALTFVLMVVVMLRLNVKLTLVALATVPMVWALRSAFRSTAAPSGAA